MSATFTSEVQLNGKTATGIPVPAEVVAALGAGQRPKVLVTIGSHTYRSSIAAYEGAFMLPLSAENRAGAEVAAGDTVEVSITLDAAERRIEIPQDLDTALAAHPGAREALLALSYSKQRQRVEPLAAAKKPETRARRIAAIVAELSGS